MKAYPSLQKLSVTINSCSHADCQKSGDLLTTDVYRKETYAGLGLNFYSLAPYLFKVTSIKASLQRAFNICSNWHSFHDEAEKLRNYFHINSYPGDLMDRLGISYLIGLSLTTLKMIRSRMLNI